MNLSHTKYMKIIWITFSVHQLTNILNPDASCQSPKETIHMGIKESEELYITVELHKKLTPLEALEATFLRFSYKTLYLSMMNQSQLHT